MPAAEEIRVSRCDDFEFIRSVFEQTFDQIRVDQLFEFGIVEESLRAVSKGHSDRLIFVQVEVNGERRGVVTSIDYELHTMFLPSLRGSQAVRAGKVVLKWLWGNTDAEAVRSYFYSNRPEVRLFARLCGFKELSTFDDGTTVGGVPILRTDLILKRPEKCP